MNLTLAALSPEKKQRITPKKAIRMEAQTQKQPMDKLLFQDPAISIEKLKSLETGLVAELKMEKVKNEVLRKEVEVLSKRDLEQKKLIDELRAGMAAVEARFSEKHQEVVRLQAKIDDCEETIKKQKNEIADLSENHDASKEKLKKKITLLEEMSDMMTEKLDEYQETIDELEKKIERKDNDYLRLKEIYDQLLNQKSHVAEKLEHLKKDKSHLKTHLLKVQNSCNNIKSKYGLVDDQIQILLEENRSLDKEKNDLQALLEDYRKENDMLQANLHSMITDGDFSEDHLTDLIGDLAISESPPFVAQFQQHGNDLSIAKKGTIVRRTNFESLDYQSAFTNHIFKSGNHSVSIILDDLVEDSDILIGIIAIADINVNKSIGYRGWCIDLGDGAKVHQNKEEDYDNLSRIQDGDEIIINFNADDGVLSYTWNGLNLGVAFSGISHSKPEYTIGISFGFEGRYSVSLRGEES